jgi:hypothetical protein
MLKSSEIVVMNEMSLFQFVLKWVEKNIVPTMKNETCTISKILGAYRKILLKIHLFPVYTEN